MPRVARMASPKKCALHTSTLPTPTLLNLGMDFGVRFVVCKEVGMVKETDGMHSQ